VKEMGSFCLKVDTITKVFQLGVEKQWGELICIPQGQYNVPEGTQRKKNKNKNKSPDCNWLKNFSLLKPVTQLHGCPGVLTSDGKR
jgi:hypothetical protein